MDQLDRAVFDTPYSRTLSPVAESTEPEPVAYSPGSPHYVQPPQPEDGVTLFFHDPAPDGSAGITRENGAWVPYYPPSEDENDAPDPFAYTPTSPPPHAEPAPVLGTYPNQHAPVRRLSSATPPPRAPRTSPPPLPRRRTAVARTVPDSDPPARRRLTFRDLYAPPEAL